jgi:DNA-binding CsgD family transcriptional regulator
VTDLRRRSKRGDLTGLEYEVLRLAALGYSSRDIAQRRGVSMNTVRNERETIHYKLGVSTLVEALAVVGWLQVPDG